MTPEDIAKKGSLIILTKGIELDDVQKDPLQGSISLGIHYWSSGLNSISEDGKMPAYTRNADAEGAQIVLDLKKNRENCDMPDEEFASYVEANSPYFCQLFECHRDYRLYLDIAEGYGAKAMKAYYTDLQPIELDGIAWLYYSLEKRVIVATPPSPDPLVALDEASYDKVRQAVKKLYELHPDFLQGK